MKIFIEKFFLNGLNDESFSHFYKDGLMKLISKSLNLSVLSFSEIFFPFLKLEREFKDDILYAMMMLIISSIISDI
jgi:hypothetical protein